MSKRKAQYMKGFMKRYRYVPMHYSDTSIHSSENELIAFPSSLASSDFDNLSGDRGSQDESALLSEQYVAAHSETDNETIANPDNILENDTAVAGKKDAAVSEEHADRDPDTIPPIDPDTIPPISSETDSDNDDSEKSATTTFEFLIELREWAVDVPREKINHLLRILAQSGRFACGDLPKDARSLLRTPRSVAVVDNCGGQMVYFGIKRGILQCASEITTTFPDSCCLQLNFNIDGLPIQNSSRLQFWPILCAIHGTNIGPFTVAIYCGKQKPTSVDDYLEQFISEVFDLQENGVNIDNICYSIKVHCFICDAPARSYVKCVAGHTSKNGCERCDCVGASVDRRIVFLTEGTNRTDDAFRSNRYPIHKTDDSPILKVIGLDIIKTFVLDSMHLLHLGACRRLLFFLKTGPRSIKLSLTQLDMISSRLIELTQHTPSDFARKPRGLCELERWKATEFRQFVLYTGIVVLKGVVNDNVYALFLSFFIAVRILYISDSRERNEKLEFARQLLKVFCHNAKILCGERFITYNIHSLIHIVDDVEHFQCSLNELSGFMFENHLQSIKRTIRGAKSNPLVSAAKRFSEYSHNNFKRSAKQSCTKISTNNRDKYFISTDGKYCEVIEIRKGEIEQEIVCFVYPSHKLQPFFANPIDSKQWGIVVCENVISVNKYTKVLTKADIKQKLYAMKHGDFGLLFVPVLHDICELKINNKNLYMQQ